MSGHTPGPWCLDTGAIYAACQLDERGMTSEDPIAEVGDGRPENYVSNCRLIAAAPELLNMLIKLRDAGIWYSSALEIDVYGKDRLDGEELEAELKALIDKATGAAA